MERVHGALMAGFLNQGNSEMALKQFWSKPWGLLFSSWLIVAFGQPARAPWLGLIAAAFGYALFWRGMVCFSRAKQRFLSAAAWFALVQCVQLSWMTSIKYVGGLVFIVYTLLCIAWGAQFAFVSLWIPSKGPIPVHKVFFIAALWTILEWSRLYILSGFSWNPVGLGLTGSPYPLQMASVTGVYGLTVWVMLTNLMVFNAWQIVEQRRESGLSNVHARKYFIAWIVLAVFPYVSGWIHISFHERRMSNASSLSVMAVQTSLRPDQKVTFEGFGGVPALQPKEQWKRILNAIKDHHGQKIDLILLPEGTVPYGTNLPIYTLSSVQEELAQIFKLKDLSELPLPREPMASPFLNEHHEPLWVVGNGYWAQAVANLFRADVMIGLEDYVKDSAKEVKSYQAAFHYQPFAETANRYEKRVLVPMGEYIPFDWCKGLAARYGVYDSFIHGKEAKVFQSETPLGISICYEETYGDLMRENRLIGAAALVNLTNDGWYPNSKLPRQHLDHARPRSVENGFALLRSCNTGVSAMIDCLGRTVAELGSDQESPSQDPQLLLATISSYNYKTLYTFWGDKFIIGLCFLTVLSYFIVRIILRFC